MGQRKHLNTKGSAVPSVGDGSTNWQNSQGKPGLLLGSLIPHAVLLMPLRGNAGHEMHPCGLT